MTADDLDDFDPCEGCASVMVEILGSLRYWADRLEAVERREKSQDAELSRLRRLIGVSL